MNTIRNNGKETKTQFEWLAHKSLESATNNSSRSSDAAKLAKALTEN